MNSVERLIQAAPAEAMPQIASLQSYLRGGHLPFETGDRDLVMGVALRYAPEIVRPFVESLFKAGRFSGEVVLFLNEGDDDLGRYLHDRGVRTEPFGQDSTSPATIVMGRWHVYWDYLTARLKEGHNYRNILLTDVRDVIFQKPLFGRPAEEIEFHLEADSVNIGQCEWNSAWIRSAFGDEVLERLADRRISCAGVVSGRTGGIMRYLAWMRILSLSLPADGRARNHDQPLHNFILHNGLLEEARVQENFRRVATLHHLRPELISTNDDAALINPDGSISEIAHQWDRHPSFAARVAANAKIRFLGTGGLIDHLVQMEAAADSRRRNEEVLKQQLAQASSISEQLSQRLANMELWLEEARLRLEETRLRLEEARLRLEETRLRLERTELRLGETQLLADSQRRHVENLQEQLRQVINSTSWKLLQPIHRLAGRHLHLRQLLRGTAYMCWWVITRQLREKPLQRMAPQPTHSRQTARGVSSEELGDSSRR